MATLSERPGPCPHGTINDVCWRCTFRESAARGERYAVSAPALSVHEKFALDEAFDSGRITQGPRVEAFESALAERFTMGGYAVACSSGTAALHLGLLASLFYQSGGARASYAGKEVLIPAETFVATANAVAYLGAKPVICDIDPQTWAIDLEDAQRRVTKKTVALIGVHLYGRRAPMALLLAFCRVHGLALIEDAAEAIGGCYPIGHLSDCATLSFYGNKVITTAEGGAVLTNNRAVAEEARRLRGHAQSRPGAYHHDAVGFNYRMTDLHAAIGLAQLRRVEQLVGDRRWICEHYRNALSPLECWQGVDAPWLFTVLLPAGCSRDRIREEMSKLGVETRPGFVPMHQLPMYADGERRPVAEDFAARALSLPTHPHLKPYDAQAIAGLLRELIDEDFT